MTEPTTPHQGAERVFTIQELHRAETEGRYLVAFEGVVYDLTTCPKWRAGMHENLHFPGQDLTGELVDAPHGEEVFQHPCVRRVGILAVTNG